MHAREPLLGGDFHGALRQAVTRPAGAREPHRSCRDVVGITAHARRFVGEVELRIQVGESGLGLLAFGDIDVDANHPLCVPIAVVGNETARFDPSNLAVADNAIFGADFTTSLAKCLMPECGHSREVVRVYAALPVAARTFGGPLGQSMYGRITFRN